jgi:NodT family efflux transporter outer membrane factor (OMF) lipoprotein
MVNKYPWQQGVSLLVLTTVLSGCAAFGPDHTPANLLTPAQLSLPATQGKMPEAGWWQQLNDPTLNKLIDTAVARSPSLQQAQNRLNEAKGELGLSESHLGPQVNLSATDDRQLYSANGIFGAEPAFAGHYINDYTLTLNASWEIDFWGKNRAQIKAALGEMRAAMLETQQAQLVLTQAVIGQYTAIQLQQQQLQINQARIRLADTRIQLMKARVSAGILSADTVFQVQTARAALEAQNASIKGDIQRSRHALAALTGQTPTALDTLTVPDLAPAPEMDGARLSLDLLGRRPDIASQRAQVESMAETVTAAKAAFYPNISISAFAGVNSLAYGTLFQHASRIADFQPALTLPIFNSGELRSNLHVQQARYDQAVNSYNQSILDGLRDAADAMTGEQQAKAQLQQANLGYRASTRSADAMTLRLKAGMVNKLDVLDSQDAVLAQRSTELNAVANQRLAWAKLNTALGGGELASPTTR